MGGSPAWNPAVAKTLGCGHTLLPAHTERHPAGPQRPRPAFVGCVCRGSRAGHLGKDGSRRSPPKGRTGGSREDLSPHSLSHRDTSNMHACMHTRTCAPTRLCVHTRVCTRNDTRPAPEPGPQVQDAQPEAWARSPLSSSRRPRGEPGSARELCPEVHGRPAGESGGSEAWRAEPPQRHSTPARAPPPRSLPGWQHSLGAAPCSQPSPHRTAPSASREDSPSPAAPPGSSSSAPSLSHTPVPTPAPPLVCFLGGHLAPPTCLWPAQPCRGDPRLQHGASDPQRQMWEWTKRAGPGAPGTRSWKRGGWGGRGQLSSRAGTGMGVPESADRRGPRRSGGWGPSDARGARWERGGRGLPWTPGGSEDKGSVQQQQARLPLRPPGAGDTGGWGQGGESHRVHHMRGG